jgi:hypothetical protein
VFTAGDNSGGAQVESVPAIGASGPPAEIATAITQAAYDVGVGSYQDGALIAADNDTTAYTTRVAYAAAGKDFDASSSYVGAGTFPGEQLVGISGDALLTEKTAGDGALVLRIFNGTSFGPAYEVPDTAGGGPEWFGIDTDPSGRVHVFNDSTHLARTYDLYEESTSTGAAWSAPVDLGNAVEATSFAVGLDASGSGLVLGTSPAIGYPVPATLGG